jgi:hypothetical protein
MLKIRIYARSITIGTTTSFIVNQCVSTGETGSLISIYFEMAHKPFSLCEQYITV